MRHVPLRARLVALALAALLVGGCATAGSLGGPAIGGSLAAQVGDLDYTHADLRDDVEAWAANPEFLATVLGITDVGTPGARPISLVTFVLSHEIMTAQSRAYAAQVGYELDPDYSAQILDQIDAQFVGSIGEPLFRGYPDAFRTQLADDFQYQDNLLNTADPATLDVPSPIVNPRYGTFDTQNGGIGQVVAPEGARLPGIRTPSGG